MTNGDILFDGDPYADPDRTNEAWRRANIERLIRIEHAAMDLVHNAIPAEPHKAIMAVSYKTYKALLLAVQE